MAKNSFTVEIDGAFELGVKFSKMDLLTSAKVRAITIKRGYAVERLAKQLVPVDTGHLRRSIRTQIANGGLTALIGTNVNYAIYIEKGTRYMAGRPYMFPAFLVNRDKYLREIRGVLKEVT